MGSTEIVSHSQNITMPTIRESTSRLNIDRTICYVEQFGQFWLRSGLRQASAIYPVLMLLGSAGKRALRLQRGVALDDGAHEVIGLNPALSGKRDGASILLAQVTVVGHALLACPWPHVPSEADCEKLFRDKAMARWPTPTYMSL